MHEKPSDWWDDLAPENPPTNPSQEDEEMLRLIAYDIAQPKRLQKVAAVCEDFGVRIQKSLFECWLDDDRFAELWQRLLDTIDTREDCLVAYSLQADSANRRLTAGDSMAVTSHQSVFVF